MSGTLYLCGTPIGNLEDISLRALRMLKEVDLIAAEDTRRTRQLTQHYGIATPLVSYHQHNRRVRGPELIEALKQGKSVAVVTDAGLPGISDPGEELVGLAIAAGLQVVPVPGPTAALVALVASGAPTDRFVFEGFLPRRGRERLLRLAEIAAEPRTVVLYEAPHRLLHTLDDLARTIPRRMVTVARELTKHFEEFRRGTPEELRAHFQQTPPRGEFTLVLHADSTSPKEEKAAMADHLRAVEELRYAGGKSFKQAVQEVAARRGVSRRELYQAALGDKKRPGGTPVERPQGCDDPGRDPDQ